MQIEIKDIIIPEVPVRSILGRSSVNAPEPSKPVLLS